MDRTIFVSYHFKINPCRITPLKPPGGDCHLVVGGGQQDSDSGDDGSVTDVKVSCRVTQPPDGSTTKLFDNNENIAKTSKPLKPYRLNYYSISIDCNIIIFFDSD